MGQWDKVVDLDRFVDVAIVNGPNGPVFSNGAMTTLGAPKVTFFSYGSDGELPRSIDLRLKSD